MGIIQVGVGRTDAYHALQKQSAGGAIIRPMKSIAKNLSTQKEHSRVEPCETNRQVCLRVYSKTLVKLTFVRLKIDWV